ncbi:hypothetical protein K439DRAFT_1375420 [Ramaria rubella]|nr:hypothetical protein K439DRAFT_1375420 [Ramaria rubella]
MSNPYSPTVAEGESPAGIWFEKSLFDGAYLSAVAYGVHLAVFSITAYFLTCWPAKGRISWPFFSYIVLLLACGTINLGAGIKFAEMAWIDDRDFPGGPAAFNTLMYSNKIETLGNAAYITANFLADGLLIWRCFIVYNHNYWVILVPMMAFMASTGPFDYDHVSPPSPYFLFVGLSILTVFQAAQPTASIWSKSAVVIAIPYWSLSIALNAVVSLLIVCRMLWHRHSIGKTLGPRHSALYTSVAAMFVESAAMYAITGLVYIICFARNSNVQNLVLGILCQVECMAPELIILRVALGRAWSKETTNGGMSAHLSFEKVTNGREHDSNALVDMFGSPRTTQPDTLNESTGTQFVSYDKSKISLHVV